jgi:hypothetical protein
MSTHRNLSSLPPAVLLAAHKASVKRERERIQKEIRKLESQLDKLEKEPDAPKQEKPKQEKSKPEKPEKPEKPIASGSEDKIKQQKVDSSNDKPVEVIDVDEWYDRHWAVVKERKLGEGAGR